MNKLCSANNFLQKENRHKKKSFQENRRNLVPKSDCWKFSLFPRAGPASSGWTNPRFFSVTFSPYPTLTFDRSSQSVDHPLPWRKKCFSPSFDGAKQKCLSYPDSFQTDFNEETLMIECSCILQLPSGRVWNFLSRFMSVGDELNFEIWHTFRTKNIVPVFSRYAKSESCQ